MPRRSEPTKPPDWPAERALSALKQQLTGLDQLRGRNFREAENSEQEWKFLTESVIEHSFGNPSTNLSHFHMARWAGQHRVGGMSDRELQRNFEARVEKQTAFLRSCIAEIELSLPETDIAGTYERGEEYKFYRDVRVLISRATTEVFVVDNYLDSELFDVYVVDLDPNVRLRVLGDQLRSPVLAVAQKFARRGNFELRTGADVHDRVLFVDDRCWVIGQSIKDAAKKKPTYIVEHTSSTMRPIYEVIWANANQII